MRLSVSRQRCLSRRKPRFNGPSLTLMVLHDRSNSGRLTGDHQWDASEPFGWRLIASSETRVFRFDGNSANAAPTGVDQRLPVLFLKRPLLRQRKNVQNNL